MGDIELHVEQSDTIEKQLGRSGFRLLMGFWFGIFIAAAGFLSAIQF
tara:strand:- start:282 stop:422 length:141 start_codon:yes stop_codon:yes gene_type:complete